MATAAQVVKQILSEINTRASEAPLEPDEIQDTIFHMNTYMFAQAADGVNLGYTAVNNLGDEVTVPDGALMGLIANVAIMMAPTFEAEVSQALASKAAIGYEAMLKLGVSMSEAEYPSILPRGSGNEQDWTDCHFYPEREATILQESGGSIGLESDT